MTRRATRRSRCAATLLATALVGSIGLLQAGAAVAQESYPVSVDGLPIAGHGYGHGRGMGQYGAQGAALRGVGYRDILGFYYPNTGVGALPGPNSIRVLVSEDTDDDITVWPADGLAVSDADGRRWLLPPGPERWRVVADPSGGQHVEQLLAGRWAGWERQGGGAFYAARFEGAPRLRLALPDGTSRAYRGTLTATRDGGATVRTVNTVSFEDYLRSVVPSESPATFHTEALKAQAVAARTYAGYKRASATGGAYDICSTTACQVYPGAADWTREGVLREHEHPRTDDAVRLTAGEVRTYAGRLAFTEFTSSTGGQTVAGSVPYQIAQADPWDDFPDNPVHTWTSAITRPALQRAFPEVGAPLRVRVAARDGRGDRGGRTLSVVVEGTGGARTVTGDAFRSRLGLREAWWWPDLGLIQLHWHELGASASFLGRPVTQEYAVTGGRGQDYQGGRILWSPSTGAHEVHGLILDRWSAAGGPDGRLGLPVSDEQAAGPGRVGQFVGGHLYWSAGTGTREVHGDILGRYAALGAASGRLGLPTSDEQDYWGGRRSVFQSGRIYWRPGTGSVHVEGLILDGYLRLGEAGGVLGWPVASEEDVPGGRRSRMERGHLYWSAPTGAHEVHGAILARYLELGGSSSSLGLPVSDEGPVPVGRRSDFVGGSLIWDARTGAVTLVPR